MCDNCWSVDFVLCEHSMATTLSIHREAVNIVSEAMNCYWSRLLSALLIGMNILLKKSFVDPYIWIRWALSPPDCSSMVLSGSLLNLSSRSIPSAHVTPVMTSSSTIPPLFTGIITALSTMVLCTMPLLTKTCSWTTSCLLFLRSSTSLHTSDNCHSILKRVALITMSTFNSWS